MPDNTLEMKESFFSRNDEASRLYHFIQKPVYNIDDMDDAMFMKDHRMEGVFVIACRASIDPAWPGDVIVNGKKTAEGIISPSVWENGCEIGLPVRKQLRQYNTSYEIRYENAKTTDGETLPPFSFTLTTMPRIAPGTVYPEHDALVLDAAREGIVLLRNEGPVLPLRPGSVVNAFGKGAATFRLGCVGAGKINPRYGIRFEEGIRNFSSLQLNDELFSFYREEETNALPSAEIMGHAKERSDTAVVVLTRGTGESTDNRPAKGEYYFTDQEKELLRTVSGSFRHTVVILNTGYPIEMGWINEYSIDAILWCSLPGMAGGRALAEVLEGKVSPSGKLPDTWAYDYYDYPSSANFYIPPEGKFNSPFQDELFINTVYEEDLYVGYRYFETFRVPVAFPFGHGLSYTEFSRRIISAEKGADACRLTVCVRNTGSQAGKDVLLLFASLPEGRLEQPARRLVAFAKTGMLAPGEEQELKLNVSAKSLASYDEAEASWVMEAGCISLYLGGSVSEAVYADSLFIPERKVLKKVKNRVLPPVDFRRLSKHHPRETAPGGKLSGEVRSAELPYRTKREHIPVKHPVTGERPDHLITFPMVVEDESLLNAFILQMDDYDLARLSCGGRTGWGPEDNGFAGTLFNGGKVAKYEIPDYFMADGNNGLNMHDATIGFPVSNMIAATFNEALSFAEGEAVATEGRDLNLQCILAPAMNLHRNPLCGRHAEYFSEDPYLSGRMGGFESAGFESAGASSVMKHFFGNNAENHRYRNHSILSERAMRELYLRVFEIAVDVHMPDSFMTGYNAANGCYCAGDDELLKGILQEEFGFPGYVMTDWGSARQCPPDQAANAGNAWDAPGTMDDEEPNMILKGLQQGTVDREQVRANLRDMYAVLAGRFRENRE